MAKDHPKYNQNNRAVCYYRYSSGSQREASIEDQAKAAHEYAEQHGLEIIREYKDKAKSGRTTEGRDGYLRMLSEMPRLKPSTLIVWHGNRLGRNAFDTLRMRMDAVEQGVELVYTDGQAPDLRDMMGLIAAVVEDTQSEDFSDKLSADIRRGIQHNAERGLYCGRPILGYAGEAGKPYAIDEKTAPVVRRIFAEYASGASMQQIADELNEQGIRTSWGNEFTINGLRSILHNDAYIGVYKYAGHVIEGGMPIIIERYLFDQVQRKFAENKRGGAPRRATLAECDEDAPRFWLTGKLYCGHCGRPMWGISGTSKTGAKHYYYACKGKTKRMGCRKRNIRKDEIEAEVLQTLRDFLTHPELLADIAAWAADYYKGELGGSSCIDSLKAELRETESALSNILKAIEAGIFNDMTQNRMLELQSRREALMQSILIEEANAELFEDESTFEEYLCRYANADLCDEETRDEVLEYFVDRIYVFDDRIELTGWFADPSYWWFAEDLIENDSYVVRWPFLQELEFEPFALNSTTENRRP